MKARINKRTIWRDWLDERHAVRLISDQKKKDEAFARLKGEVELINLRIELAEKEKKTMTFNPIEIRPPKDAAEQAKLMERQASNILRAKGLKTKFDDKKQTLIDAREQMLASMSPGLRKKYEADLDAKNDFNSKLADIRAEMHEETAALRTEVNAISAVIKETGEYLSNPISVANAYMIGSPRRDSIARSIEGAGPKKLSELLMTARLTGDLELGAEVLSATEKADKKYRFAPPMTIAESLFGPKVAGVKDNTKLAEIQFATIHETLAEVEGVRPMNTVEKRSLSMKHDMKERIVPRNAA